LEHADEIIHARWLLPVEPADAVLEDHALAIRDGRILGIARSAEAAALWQAPVERRLGRHLLMPGLVNAHCHAAMTLLRGLADDHALMEWLQDWIWPAEGRFVGEDFVRTGTRLAIAEMLRSGTTCFSDMYFFPDVAAEAVIETGIRAQIAFPILEHPTAWARTADEYLSKGLHVRDRFKSNPRLGFAFGPHAPYTNSDATLARVAVLAAELDSPVQIHLHETAGEVADSISAHGLRPIQRLERLGLLSPRLQAVHMTQISPADRELLLRERASVVHCPSSNLKLASGFCPTRDLLAAGVNVCIGTDGAASNNDLDMLGELRSAALLAKAVAGDPCVVPAHEALQMATLNGARALGLEQDIGSLIAGKQADLMAIDLGGMRAQPVYDPISQIVYAGHRDQITDVWVGGRRVVRERQLLTLNERELAETAERWRAKIAEG
jgi:5-methylthioadenosine/S-adenosylhomocysteine deaminase